MSNFASLSAGMLGLSVKKVAGMVTVILTSLAVPAAAIAIGPEGSAQVGVALKESAKVPIEVGSQIYSSASDPKTFSSSIKEVTDWVKNPINTLQEKTNPIKNIAGSSYSVAASAYDKVSSTPTDTVNYYAFMGGEFTKAVIRTLPMMIRDTVRSTFHDTTQYKFISIQKLYRMFSVKEFEEAFAKLIELIPQRKILFDQITHQQANNIINILKGIKEDENDAWIKYFWTKIKTNISDISATDTFNNTEELLERIFIGKDKFPDLINKLLCNVENGKQKLETSSLDGINKDTVTQLIEMLKKLKTTIKGKPTNKKSEPLDTCSSGAGSQAA